MNLANTKGFGSDIGAPSDAFETMRMAITAAVHAQQKIKHYTYEELVEFTNLVRGFLDK